MIYRSAGEWRRAPCKRVLLFGMSGLGKTHLSTLLREAGDWFHYSVDYRIGTRYMGEHIVDNFKRVAMREPFLRDLLRSDSIYIASNITFNNLAPLSTYLGKPGDPAQGGLPVAEYLKRQEQHRRAEVAALLDTRHFIERARELYGYDHFVCDSGGSICEVVDPGDAADPVLSALAQDVLMIWIEGTQAHAEELVARFDRAPKPMYYRADFLRAAWAEHLETEGLSEAEVDPDVFVRWVYARALAHRRPLYAEIAEAWGIRIAAADVARVRDVPGFIDLVAAALEAKS